ncbi:MAG TPA: c-type cytochrome domain-containing protein [Anaerolineales bacterium]|nr:c-type cytochrome domain-containing protein [Anaerolineales bacterium]
MKSMHAALVIALLIVGLLSACGTQATEAPAAAFEVTEVSVEPTQGMTETSAPSDTAVPESSPVPPTNVPATQASSQGMIVSFAVDILPLFESRCKNCHGGNRIEEGLVLLSYADIMKGSQNGPVVTPGSANNSLLVELLVNQKMPKRGPKLTPSQIQPIIDWINQGALEN